MLDPGLGEIMCRRCWGPDLEETGAWSVLKMKMWGGTLGVGNRLMFPTRYSEECRKGTKWLPTACRKPSLAGFGEHLREAEGGGRRGIPCYEFPLFPRLGKGGLLCARGAEGVRNLERGHTGIDSFIKNVSG